MLSQLLKSLHRLFSRHMRARGIRARHDSAIRMGERGPRAWWRDICIIGFSNRTCSPPKPSWRDLRSAEIEGDSQVAPASAADASIVGRFHFLIVSRTPSSSSPCVVKPVTFLPLMMDLDVEGSSMPGKMAPPWQLGGCQFGSERVSRELKGRRRHDVRMNREID